MRMCVHCMIDTVCRDQSMHDINYRRVMCNKHETAADGSCNWTCISRIWSMHNHTQCTCGMCRWYWTKRVYVCNEVHNITCVLHEETIDCNVWLYVQAAPLGYTRLIHNGYGSDVQWGSCYGIKRTSMINKQKMVSTTKVFASYKTVWYNWWKPLWSNSLTTIVSFCCVKINSLPSIMSFSYS